MGAVATEQPDVLVLDWNEHLPALGVTPSDVLTRPRATSSWCAGLFRRR